MTDRFKEKITISKEAHYNHYRISIISIWFRIPKIWNTCFLPHSGSKISLGSQCSICKHWATGKYLYFWKCSDTEDDPFRLFLYTNGFAFQCIPRNNKERIKGLLYETGQETENIESNNDFSLPVNYSTWNFLPSITLGQHWSLSSYFPCKLSNI